MCDGETLDERRLKEFDELYTTWRLASQRGYLYFEGNGVQGLANLMASSDNYEFFQGRRSHALKQFGEPVDSLLPMRLGQLALEKFRQYNDIYQIAGAYVSIGRYLNAVMESINRHLILWCVLWSVSTIIIAIFMIAMTAWIG